jgi:hypothetical protein
LVVPKSKTGKNRKIGSDAAFTHSTEQPSSPYTTFFKLTQKKGFGRFNLAIYWKRKYKGKQEQSPWYLLTNLPDCETAVKIYSEILRYALQ